MPTKQISKLNLQKMIQGRSYAEKFDLIEVENEQQIRGVTTALKKKLKDNPGAVLVVL